MRFGAHHYVPVLKVKRAEKKALQCISPSVRARIIPLLEIVERKPDTASTIGKHLDNAFAQLANSVSPYSRCFLDTREIAADGAGAAAEVFRRASSAGMVFTPVTGISRNVDVAPALEHRTHGIALRVIRREFECGRLGSEIEAFLHRHELEPENVDLIIDLGTVEDLIAVGIATLSKEFMDDIPHHKRWHTFTISACAFPKSMGRVERKSHHFTAREEWIAWTDHLHELRHNLLRLPTFSDCAIQNPVGVEGFDPRTMQVSASIRYTLSDAWLLIKGESTRVTRPGAQFPEIATSLVYGHLQRHFVGGDHCVGCASMKAAADGTSGFGSAEAWRRLGTIHHISMVVEGLRSLPGS